MNAVDLDASSANLKFVVHALGANRRAYPRGLQSLQTTRSILLTPDLFGNYVQSRMVVCD